MLTLNIDPKIRFNKYLLLLATLFGINSCTDSKQDREELVLKIESFKNEKSRYPTNLNEINELDNKYCYYLSNNSFNIEYTSFGDLYWYNSGNDVWDFLEGDADKLHCK